MNRDLTLGCVTLALAAAYYAAAALLPQSQLDDAVGPGGLPKTYAVVLAVLSLALIAQSLRRRQKDAARRVQKDPPYGNETLHSRNGSTKPLVRVLGMLAIGVVYIVVAPWMGYILSLAALILTTTYYQGGVINRHVAVVAVTGALFFWVLFVFVLGIPQPSGFWPSLF